jgi:hypothetical protein
MIEPFEFEPIKLSAKPMESAHSSLASTRLDQSAVDGVSKFHAHMNEITLDNAQGRVYQTKIGNPDEWNSHTSRYVPDRLVQEDVHEGQGESISMSRRLSHYLDSQASFVPNIDRHLPLAFQVISPDEPCFSPGLTSIDRHKYMMNIK